MTYALSCDILRYNLIEGLVMTKITLDAYDPEGRLIAKCSSDDYGAPLLMSLHGEGSTIRVGKKIVWLEGADGEGAESYDGTIEKIFSRLK